MKSILTFTLLVFSILLFGQIKNNKLPGNNTTKYAGVYSYGTNPEKGRIGTIYIFLETDSTVLFYFDLNRGAPSYNMGFLYGRVKINNDTGTFSNQASYAEGGCQLSFTFSKKNLAVKTIDDTDECGFGFSVIADGIFKKTLNKAIEYFEDNEGKKIYFRKTTPEEYYKDE